MPSNNMCLCAQTVLSREEEEGRHGGPERTRWPSTGGLSGGDIRAWPRVMAEQMDVHTRHLLVSAPWDSVGMFAGHLVVGCMGPVLPVQRSPKED